MTDDKNNKICTYIKVEFKRINITYIKDLYIIMTDDMKSSIKNNGNIQYFSDTIYFCIPLNVNLLKMLILLSYIKMKIKF